MIFHEKGTNRLFGTDTWHNGLWYMDRKDMGSALSSIVGITRRLREVLSTYYYSIIDA
jgi:hypothetical protein